MRIPGLLLALLITVGCGSAGASMTIIQTTSLPNGTVATPYSAQVVAAGGCTPYTWSIPSGSLPPGLHSGISADTKSMAITGTPTTAGTYAFSVRATGCWKHKSTVSYTVQIAPAIVPVQHVTNLSWNAVSATNLLGYNVYRGTAHLGPYAKLNAVVVASTLYADSTVASGKTYYYVSTTVDNTGKESSYSNEAVAVIPYP